MTQPFPITPLIPLPALWREDTEILLEREDGFVMAVPLTEDALKRWGVGTAWVANEKDDAKRLPFKFLNAAAPFVVLRWPDGQCLLVRVAEGEDDMVFNIAWEEDWSTSLDKPDEEIRALLEMTIRFAPYHTVRVVSDNYAIALAMDKARPTLWTEAVRADVSTLRLVPNHFLSKVSRDDIRAACVDAVRRMLVRDKREPATEENRIHDLLMYARIPQEFHQDEEVRAAARAPAKVKPELKKRHSDPLPPEDERTAEFYLDAVRRGMFLHEVPEAMRGRDVCLEGVKRKLLVGGFDRRIYTGWEHVPQGVLDREAWLEAVTLNGLALDGVPENWRDCEMCLTAVTSNGLALEVVPVELRDRDMCLAAVRNNGWALEHVPPFDCYRRKSFPPVRVTEVLQDREVCLEAVRQNGEVVGIVPEALCDQEMMLTSVRDPAAAYQAMSWTWFPRRLPGVDVRAVAMEALSRNGNAIKQLPEALKRDVELLGVAVAQNPSAIYDVPEDLRDKVRVAAHAPARDRVMEAWREVAVRLAVPAKPPNSDFEDGLDPDDYDADDEAAPLTKPPVRPRGFRGLIGRLFPSRLRISP